MCSTIAVTSLSLQTQFLRRIAGDGERALRGSVNGGSVASAKIDHVAVGFEAKRDE